MTSATDTNRLQSIIILHELALDLLRQHLSGGAGVYEVTASDVEDSITKKKISLEKDKERLRHAKQVEKQNDAFRKKHEQNQKQQNQR